MTTAEFQEIAHSGGKISVGINAAQRSYQLTFRSSRAVPWKLIAIYALEQGIPVRQVTNLGGLGAQLEPAPFPECYLVMISSDSEGHPDEAVNFLSTAQRRHVAHYCDALTQALNSRQDGELTIDMDAVADAAGKDGEKPPFYVSEESQQHKFYCAACAEFNDVIGRFAYCSSCGTRNDLALFKTEVAALHARVATDNTGMMVREAISAFDNVVGQYTKQLLQLVPLSKRRAERLKRGRFHDLDAIVDILSWFDIDALNGMTPNKRDFLKRMFLRRHVYEHNGGEVDEVYLKKSGDTTVRLKQHLSETVADVHQLLGDLERIAHALHSGFHELLPPLEEPIKEHEETLARRTASPEAPQR
jgi:hypothetical protein